MDINSFLNNYPAGIASLFSRVQEYLRNQVPDLMEEIDLPSRILIYRLSPGMKGIVFTLIPSIKGVKLGIYRGRDLEDPNQLMQGKGKVHSTIQMTHEILNSPELAAMISLAAGKARARINKER